MGLCLGRTDEDQALSSAHQNPPPAELLEACCLESRETHMAEVLGKSSAGTQEFGSVVKEEVTFSCPGLGFPGFGRETAKQGMITVELPSSPTK